MRADRRRRHRRRLHLRKRGIYLAAALAVMLSGLASRAYAASLPDFLAANAGDALWAAMVYLGVRLLLPERRRSLCALCALLLSFGIEFSQMYRAPWIDGLRHTVLGALILGRGFLTADLARYTVGIAAAFAADAAVGTGFRHKKNG
ncbi:ribosomal maturation YjgA family protein [Saccharibacillus alkalitolerans]|uniref:DUF2809 domain-containing protein n=1 Tax=Saccharibacillus alkalitolerans TaxID=2705290 RepID=A0ABX0F5L2_9BACL|nr:DUF2809 domain-containing protein [Saccharibacillus alkalitolerans]NGZ75658.1 DUF2809 domain-containing protein [Saccharibacillus alkalitolerans]